MNAIKEKELVKIGFKLQRDEEGYPPADWEWLWAKPIGESEFAIDNIPFFAKGISFEDVVYAERTGDELTFKELLRPSGHSTVRLVIFRGSLSSKELGELVDEVTQVLRKLGARTELSHIPNLIAVDVPPQVPYESIVSYLRGKENDGILEYEESSLASR